LGLATARDIAAHYGVEVELVRLGLHECVPTEVVVEGWDDAVYMSTEAKVSCSPLDPLLIGPFDNLIRDRRRARRVFEYEYSLEAYKPARNRIYGPYAMSVLVGNEIVGRVDVRRIGGDLVIEHCFPKDNYRGGDFFGDVLKACGVLAGHLGGIVR